MEKNTVLVGNNMVHLAEMPDNSVDAIVTDPPYGLSFMGKKWDYDVPAVDIWRECFRVLKPGGLVYDPFAGSGTTIIAAILEGFEGIGSEMEVDYAEIANKRIKNECGLFINL